MQRFRFVAPDGTTWSLRPNDLPVRPGESYVDCMRQAPNGGDASDEWKLIPSPNTTNAMLLQHAASGCFVAGERCHMGRVWLVAEQETALQFQHATLTNPRFAPMFVVGPEGLAMYPHLGFQGYVIPALYRVSQGFDAAKWTVTSTARTHDTPAMPPQHPRQQPAGKSILVAASAPSRLSAASLLVGRPVVDPTRALTRIATELKDAAAVITQHAGVECLVTSVDAVEPLTVARWEVKVRGPSNTPYEELVLTMSVTFPSDYPFKPPMVQLQHSNLFHPNISQQGKPCLDILSSNWSPALTAPRCIASVVLLLVKPNPLDPLNMEAAGVFRNEPDVWASRVRKSLEGTPRWTEASSSSTTA